MFEHLFGSKTRVKLLSLFLNNPGRSFYVREITRKIDEQINSVRRELGNMLSIGIIKSDSSNNRLYYEANPKYEYYPQLKSIFANIPISNQDLKETKEEELIAKKLRTTGTVELAFLTGMFVRDSLVNTDMFVMGDVNRAKVAKVIAEIEKDMSREINYTIMTPDEFHYRLSLNDRFLSSVMEAKKIPLIDSHQESVSPPVEAEPETEEETKIPVNVDIDAI